MLCISYALTQLKLRYNLATEDLKGISLLLGKFVRLIANGAQGTNCMSFWGDKLSTGIKPNIGVARYKRIVAKAWILTRIGDFKYFSFEDCMGAKCQIAVSLCSV